MSAAGVRKLLAIGTVLGAAAVAARVLRGGPAPAFLPDPPRAPGLLTPARPGAATAPVAPEPAAPTVPTAPTGRGQATTAPTGAGPVPEPPTAPDDGPAAEAPASTARPAHLEERRWVEPVDGTCPPGYPVKAKLKSGIYHRPGMSAYDRTRADRCYPTAEAAEADGLRPAKH